MKARIHTYKHQEVPRVLSQKDLWCMLAGKKVEVRLSIRNGELFVILYDEEKNASYMVDRCNLMT